MCVTQVLCSRSFLFYVNLGREQRVAVCFRPKLVLSIAEDMFMEFALLSAGDRFQWTG